VKLNGTRGFSLSSLQREERAGERRAVFVGFPLSSILSPLVPRGERKGHRRRQIA
jgi:hypothetical protein